LKNTLLPIVPFAGFLLGVQLLDRQVEGIDRGLLLPEVLLQLLDRQRRSPQGFLQLQVLIIEDLDLQLLVIDLCDTFPRIMQIKLIHEFLMLLYEI